MKAIVLCIFLGGCLVVPRSKTTVHDVGTEQGDLVEGPTKKLVLQSELSGSVVAIRANAERTCTRPIYRLKETRTEKHAKYEGTKDARAGLFALFLAPVTIPVSALFTGIAVLADGDGETSTTRTQVAVDTAACTTVAAGVAVIVRMPSGKTVTEMTNDQGIARVRIPDSEPYTGLVVVTGPNETSSELRYTRAMPAITSVRETVMTCAAVHGVTGSVHLELAIDTAGKAETIQLDAGDGLFSACVHEGLAKTRFSAAHRGAKLMLPFEVSGGNQLPSSGV